MFINFVVFVIVTEAITELLTKSDFFKPLRKYLFKHNKNKVCWFIHEVLDCGYCTSVWVALFTSYFLMVSLYVNDFLLWFILWILVHRGSNIAHNLIDLMRRV